MDVLIGEIRVHRSGIIDHGGDTLLLEFCLEGIALLTAVEAKGILRSAGQEALGDDGCLYSILQEFCIFGSDFVDGSKFIVGKGLEFDLKDCGLKGGEAGVHADANIVVFERVLAMDAVGVGQCCPFIIVCEYGPAVTITAEGVGREERRGADVAEATGFLAHYLATETLSAVFKDELVIEVGYLTDSGIVGRKAEKIDGDDNLWCQFSFGTDFQEGTLQIGC